ncbi:response regulator transcription factor [Alkalihalobacterium chitinilyticum]|uniref:LuxR C-terminal-related transcriptional regulator n=1 Tax=Alkalihalobacterium chitinilyticum TaxID=2980103 RepID=A0ABT5VDT8_9BACI|nr:LuxR C-terminal-related transcriptional regulator [Alkalihalobacterium chitinilyticum]MDE5413613.1 LuxR C-terminal-related transcriptional regulator [Alkalihalobacterium chitinilyticum]
MLNARMFDYIHRLQTIEDPLKRVEWIMRGCTIFFPFKRGTIYTYSPLNYLGEGIILIEEDTIEPLNMIKEDVRNFPPIYYALSQKRPHQTIIEPKNWPIQYIEQFQLTSLVIIPICYSGTVIGTALIDRSIEEQEVTKDIIDALYQYFQISAQWLFPHSSGRQKLSKREKEVLQKLSYGYSLKEMADFMGLSEFTVRDYLTSASRKLGTKHRTEAVAVAMRNGLII